MFVLQYSEGRSTLSPRTSDRIHRNDERHKDGREHESDNESPPRQVRMPRVDSRHCHSKATYEYSSVPNAIGQHQNSA